MDKHYQNLYASLNRLQNFPLDLTCVYETLEKAKEYTHRERTKAYAGQVLVVYGDPENNGIYAVISGAETASGLTLQKSANAKDLDALKEEINNEIKTQLGDLDKKFQSLQTEIDNIQKNLSKEFFDKIDKTEADVAKLKNDLASNISDVNQTIANTKAELEYKIKLLYNDPNNTLNSIVGIANWIKEHEDLFASFGNLENKITVAENDIRLIKEENSKQDKLISAIQKNISDINTTISDLHAKDIQLENSIIDLRSKIDKHVKVSMSAIKTVAYHVENAVLDNIDIDVVIPSSNATFNCFISSNDADSEGDLLISSEDITDEYTENGYSLVDISDVARYSYKLNYRIEGSSYIKFVTTAANESEQLQLDIYFSISSPNDRIS